MLNDYEAVSPVALGDMPRVTSIEQPEDQRRCRSGAENAIGIVVACGLCLRASDAEHVVGIHRFGEPEMIEPDLAQQPRQ